MRAAVSERYKRDDRHREREATEQGGAGGTVQFARDSGTR